jgi:hypothetical protein
MARCFPTKLCTSHPSHRPFWQYLVHRRSSVRSFLRPLVTSSPQRPVCASLRLRDKGSRLYKTTGKTFTFTDNRPNDNRFRTVRDLRFLRRRVWRCLSSGMLLRVVSLKLTDVSEVLSTSSSERLHLWNVGQFLRDYTALVLDWIPEFNLLLACSWIVATGTAKYGPSDLRPTAAAVLSAPWRQNAVMHRHFNKGTLQEFSSLV